MTPETLLIRSTVAVELRRMRVAAGMTQKTVSALSGIHRPIVCRIERGIHEQKMETVTRFVETVGGDVLDVTRAIDRALGLPRDRVREVAVQLSAAARRAA